MNPSNKIGQRDKMAKKYTTLSDIDHVLQRPEVHIGSVQPSECIEYVVDDNFTIITEKSIIASEAIVRIFVEVLANAVDNIQRSHGSSTPCKLIKVDIDDTGRTTVFNDGEIIKITQDENDGIAGSRKYNHELVFGHLRSSSNYDDSVKRETSGKNGIGVKCTNIFSKSFKVTGVDPGNRKKLVQEWTNNMKNTNGPSITSTTLKTGFTEVSYVPDFTKFHCDGYSDDIIGVFRKCVLDVAMLASSEGVSVKFNGKKLPIKKFSDYINFFNHGSQNGKDEAVSIVEGSSEAVVIFSKEGRKRPISFVNGLFTKDGGQHVDGWTKPFFAQLLSALNKNGKAKSSDLKLTQKDLTSHFRFFVRSTVDKPVFDCQNKNKLKFPQLKYTVPDKIISKVCKWASVQELKESVLEKMVKGRDTQVIKTLNDKKKRPKVSVKEYDPANNAGTSRSSNCVLIVCEGLSAKTYAVAGISTGISFYGKERKGRDWFGILPLRGKFLNVRNASNEKMSKNAVVLDLVNAMGLTFGMDYSSQKARNSLNYGSIMIIPDPDEDGIHIEGLVLNFFHFHFPTLLESRFSKEGDAFPFISSMKIPIIKVVHGGKESEFFTHSSFQNKKNSFGKNPKVKYFKGLGTTKHEDVPKIFGKKMVVFNLDSEAKESMEKAFLDEEADERKEWLKQYDPEERTFDLDYPEKILSLDISTFVDEELIKFSIEDCKRSLPHLMDGQKESQRKVIFGLKQWNSSSEKKSCKVAQLGAFVAQKTDYKHGEQNLFDTIIKMAQDFVGSNNIPLLERDGQFGTRLSGGRDAANARYIFVKQPPILNKIFRVEDDPILDYTDDGEPVFYAPVIPLICINGSVGVGTGFSCNIPMFNPKEIIDGIKLWIEMREKGEKYVFKYNPWYKGFKGEIVKEKNERIHGRFASYGIIQAKGKETRVSELPINMWTDKFKEMCEQFVDSGVITEWKNYSDVSNIDFELKSNNSLTLEDLKLKSYIHTSNMVVFDHEGKIHRFETLNGILQRFCKERLRLYEKRRQFMLKKVTRELSLVENKKRFMIDVSGQKIKILFEEDDSVNKQLEEKNYVKDDGSFDYLLTMNIGGFRKKNIEKLDVKISALKTDIEWYTNTTDGKMWLKDIKELEPFL